MSTTEQTNTTDKPAVASDTATQSSTPTLASAIAATSSFEGKTASTEKTKTTSSGPTTATNTDASTGAQPVSTPSSALPPSSSPPPPSSSSPPSTSTKKAQAKADQYPHHVIFVVHGMGRQLEEFGNYERNVGYLVENTKTVLQSQFHDLKTDVHIIPIEWHAKLHSMVDQRMSLASLRTVPKDFNSYYGAEIVRMIVEELNEAYSTFIAKHPDFNGKIAVYALSLGGVAMFDILTCMDDDDPENEASDASKLDKEGESATTSSTTQPAATTPAKKRIRKQDQPKYRSVIPKLKFRPNFLFTVGSPVGAVMVMRNLDWDTFHPPDDIIHHNLFHPFDPLAYRVEPLIDPIFAAIPAVTLTSTGNSQLFPISLPSLASLPSIPGSISTFLENKGLPIPSIQTAVQSTLSQMTQSLKAGRWLAGATGGAERGSGTSTPAGQQAAEMSSVSSDSDNESPNEESAPGKARNLDAPQKQQQHRMNLRSLRKDADVSVTEAIAAATAATYLDQRDRGPKQTSSANPSAPAGLPSLIDGGINTTTGSPNVVTSPVRRPSLGPRRVSSRVEDETAEDKAVTGSFRTTLPTPVETDELGQQPPSTTQASTSGSEEVPPPLHMEYFLGMEKGPSTAEKMQGEGAKSRVVQEDMVRSIPSSPILDTHAGHSHLLGLDTAEFTTAKDLDDIHAAHEKLEAVELGEERKDPKGKKVTIEDDTEEATSKDESDTFKVDDIGSGRGPLHVGGRETKVPYRIDHVLQETRVDQYTNEYLLGMRSHFRYWGNRDIAYHILKNILQQQGSLEVLDLKPEMPKSVSAPKSAKEAAEAKAKANAASYHKSSQDADQQHHRKSFSFSSFNPFSGVSQSDGEDAATPSNGSGYYRRSENGGGGYTDGGSGWYGDEEELYGYRYSDLDMSSAANVGISSNTLFQNSPFSKSTSTFPSTGSGSGGGYGAPPSSTRSPSTANQGRRRSSGASSISGYGHNNHARPQHPPHNAVSSEARRIQEEGSPPSVYEDDIFVPNLTRPPRLHHRSSRLDDKRGR
ncbi:hypothetical protein EC991_006419 [Linnemannia zychae]|nr:hypothetical protein EC991_006419 [Linnemannia zychae]